MRFTVYSFKFELHAYTHSLLPSIEKRQKSDGWMNECQIQQKLTMTVGG